jgi:hypothetical protein
MSSLRQTPADAETTTSKEEVDWSAVNRVMGRTNDNFEGMNVATRVQIFQELVEKEQKHYSYCPQFEPMDTLVRFNHAPDGRYGYLKKGSSFVNGYIHIPLQVQSGPHDDLTSKFIVLHRYEEGVDEQEHKKSRSGKCDLYGTYFRRYEVDVILLSRNAKLVAIHIGFAEDESSNIPGQKYVADCYTMTPVDYSYVAKWLRTKDDLQKLMYWVPIACEQAADKSDERSKEQAAASRGIYIDLDRLF